MNNKPTDKNHSIYLHLTIALFIIVLFIKLIVVLNIPYFSTETSYNNARIARSIAEKGSFSNDNLAFGGKDVYSLSLSNFILGFFAKFMNITIAGKIINELICALFILMTYLISKEITNNRKTAFIAAVFASAVPYITKTITNTYRIYTLGFLFMLILIYLYFKLKNNNKLTYVYLLTLILGILTTQITIIFSISLVTYFLISIVYNKKLERYEKEIILFTIFSNIALSFLLLKKALAENGFNLIWQNIPEEIISMWFPKFSLIYITYLLGLSTVVLASRIIYKNMIKNQNKNFFLIFSIIFTIFILLWTNLIRFDVGMTFVAVILPIVVGYFFDDFEKYLKDTKMAGKANMFISIFAITLFATNLIPDIQTMTELKPIINEQDEQAMEWIRTSTNHDDIFFCDFSYGNIIMYFANRKVIASSDFVGIKNANTVLQDVQIIKKSRLKTNVITLLDKYNVSYLVLNKKLDEKTFENEIFKSSCFEEEFNNREIKILRLKCHITE
ncbi:hypothetical protein JXM83_05605 [Candidatus Woesearchaeota archaeon]|nr:hypothetical protein [Candidatus Woesearchaeota archaeon]